MFRPADQIGEATLLCERCGYVIEGLPEGGDGACPECGMAIALSLPERRTGSPWQRRGHGVRAGARAWAATFAAVIRARPMLMEVVRFRGGGGGRGNFGLLVINVVAAALLLAGCWVKQLLAMEFRIGGGHRFPGDVALAIAIVVGVLLTPLHAAALAALIWIEHRGIRFFGARRRWRVTRSVAWTVCAHASYWWIVGAAVALAVMLSLPTEWPRWLPTSVQWALWGWINWVWITPAAASVFVLGLLPFETAVYFGVRRCRFANAARAAAAT